ncbi:MAG: 50S ribosomal protein L31 [Thermoguttaceae bacterium]|nr:50S ribosomal protein L31 [Thermoguttaceae bacterium]
MQENIHPKYMDTKVTCGCGNSFMTRSTKPELKVDICNACHPFYTGKLKYVDTAGRIERFNRKYGDALNNLRKKGEKKED